MIKMFGFWRSAASFRVRIALKLKGLAYEEEMIDLDAGEQYDGAYHDVNPQAAVPTVIIDNGPKLTQSLAIIEYLDTLYPAPALLPEDALGKARVRSLALIFAADHHPLIVPRIRRYLKDQLHLDDAQRTAWIRHWFREGLAQGEAVMAGDARTGTFCHGDSPTMADLALISQVMGAKGFQIGTEEFPTIARITEACLGIAAFQESLPLRQKGAPAAH